MRVDEVGDSGVECTNHDPILPIQPIARPSICNFGKMCRDLWWGSLVHDLPATIFGLSFWVRHCQDRPGRLAFAFKYPVEHLFEIVTMASESDHVGSVLFVAIKAIKNV